MTIQCCVCQRVRERGQWKDQVPERDGLVSHTYCPKCLHQSLETIKEEQMLEGVLRATA